VVAASNFIGRFWWLMFILVAAAIIGIRQYYQTDAGRYQIDKIMLKSPVLGLLLRKIAVARFCRTLGTLLSSGVAILESLEITARTAGNAVIEEALLQVRKEVEEGKTIAEPLTRTEQFPPMVVQMIGVGEQTGAMDTMLSKIADFYEDEVDAAVEGMMALIEPVIIAFLGVVIGTIVVAMYLPMFSLISQIG
jgi:type IV pilus assembly protein PilC